MDVSGHKIEDYWALRHKIQDLIDEGVIIIDLLNQKCKINDHQKAYHANHHVPPRYSLTNPFIIGSLAPSNLQTESQQKEHSYESKEPEQSKPKFKPVIIIGGKKHEPTNQKKRKMDESCKEEKKLGREMKKIKSKGNF